jgi:predicted phosphoribosyltransferase
MFVDREDAGIQLGEALQKFEPEHPLLLGIARGGVEIGYYAALQLDCDFDVLIVRKMGYPQQPEAAFGAIAEDGSIYVDPSSDKYINKEIIERVQKKEKEEIKRRIEEYRQGRQLPDMENRVVIIVDDGIATGATLFAAIEMCHKKNPKQLIVAAPVSGKSRLSKLEEKLDELIVLEKRDRFFAVSEGYQKFSNLADDEVHHYLNLWKKASKEVSSDQ